MKWKTTLLQTGLITGLFLLLIIQGCKKSNGDLGDAGVAAFTATPVASVQNTFALTSTSTNAFRLQYNLGDGSATRAGKPQDTAYFPKKGTYIITLYAYGRGGYTTQTQTVTVANDDFSSIANNPTFQLLAAKTWKFDPSPTAKAVTVGTENNPAEYYGGGPLADCQLTDTYKFTFSNNVFTLTYNANGSTFNGGNVAPNYSCVADKSFNTPFTFVPSADGAGIATITLPGFTPPTRFIGVTDVTSNNYRIISINATSMVLRGGKKDETVFQFKFIAQ